MNAIRSRSARLWRIVLTIGLLLLLAGGSYTAYTALSEPGADSSAEVDYTLTQPERGTIEATVNAIGEMQPQEIVDADFATTGVVIEVVADVGQRVRRGAVLARLEPTELELAVAQARASLSQARATYEQQRAGATPAEIAAAEAQVAQAQSQLRQTQGTVTNADIAAAQADLERARANLAQLEAGPQTGDVDAAQANLDRANAALANQRDSLSAAKTQAQSRMEQAANSLRDRQSEYSQIYWDNRELEREFGNNDLAQQRRDREESSLRAVRSAEEELEQARVAYEEAQQTEASGIQQAEADIRSAQAQIDQLYQQVTPDQIATARAQIADAEANLARLMGEERAGNLGASAASVAQAQANLAQLTEPPREIDLASALAQIEQAEVSLEQAQFDLRKAVLRAPISGTVAEINIQVGEAPPTTEPALVVVDLSSFSVAVTVDEIDVAQLALAQPVALTLDALPELALEGAIATISPLAAEDSTVTTYEVTIEVQNDDPRVRAGMSANADITVAARDAALLVPRRAVSSDGGELFVEVVDAALCAAPRTELPPLPAREEVPVEAGLRNDEVIEVVDDSIDLDTCLYIAGFDARLNPLGGPPPGQRRGNR